VPIKVQSEVLGMVECYFESTAPVNRDRKQSSSASEVPERTKGRRDLEQANTSASSQASVPTRPETMVAKVAAKDQRLR
jgi:hypothetical protein